MKFFLTVFFSICLSLAAISQTNYKVSASIRPDFKNKVIIIDQGKTSFVPVIDGKISFSGNRDTPGIIQIGVDFSGNNKFMLFPIFVNGGDVEIKFINSNQFQVEGSKETVAYHNKIHMPITKINRERDSLFSKLSKTVKGDKEYIALHAELIKNIDSCYQIPQDFIYENPNSMVSIQALYSLGKGKNNGKLISLSDLDKMFLSLSSEVRASEFGQRYAERLNAWIDEEVK